MRIWRAGRRRPHRKAHQTYTYIHTHTYIHTDLHILTHIYSHSNRMATTFSFYSMSSLKPFISCYVIVTQVIYPFKVDFHYHLTKSSSFQVRPINKFVSRPALIGSVQSQSSVGPALIGSVQITGNGERRMATLSHTLKMLASHTVIFIGYINHPLSCLASLMYASFFDFFPVCSAREIVLHLSVLVVATESRHTGSLLQATRWTKLPQRAAGNTADRSSLRDDKTHAEYYLSSMRGGALIFNLSIDRMVKRFWKLKQRKVWFCLTSRNLRTTTHGWAGKTSCCRKSTQSLRRECHRCRKGPMSTATVMSTRPGIQGSGIELDRPVTIHQRSGRNV